MILIVGLGNPGRKYKKTWHNIGFRVLDEFRKESNFPRFKIDKKFQSAISVSKSDDRYKLKQKIILAKPQTFMNNSGKAVKSLTSYYKIPCANLIVIHDDLDLPLGEIKISQGKGSAGHKGVESIIQELGTQDFIRVRVGINPKLDRNKIGHVSDFVTGEIKKFVLQKFSKDEEEPIKQAIKKAGQALALAITEGPEKAMSEFNK